MNCRILVRDLSQLTAELATARAADRHLHSAGEHVVRNETEKPMRRTMLIIAGVVVLAVLIAGFAFWRMIGAPFYTPGMVRAGTNLRGPLDPPAQRDDTSYWQVEEDIRFYFTSHGNGRPILVVHGGPGYPIRRPDWIRSRRDTRYSATTARVRQVDEAVRQVLGLKLLQEHEGARADSGHRRPGG